jgi:hypothetical protein
VLGYELHYPADAVEAALPDAVTARYLLQRRAPDRWHALRRAARQVCPDLDPRVEEALALAMARLALRHGRLGQDFHAYHNEDHILEIVERRIPRLQATIGDRLPARTWTTLLLFAACHDLRQRETPQHPADAIGANEAASAAETRRLLAACGLDDGEDPALFLQLDLAIAGSTFAVLPSSSAHPLAGQGSLARRLAPWLDSQQSDWRELPALREAEHVACLAADLDTANVGEDYPLLANSALRLVAEFQYRQGRALDDPASAAPALDFLTRGQSHYLRNLHGFASGEGEITFGPQKLANAEHIDATSAALLAQFHDAPPAHAAAVAERYAALAGTAWPLPGA